MICEQARLLIGAQPSVSTPALEEHLKTCTDCARWRAETRALDADIQRALQHPPAALRARSRGAPPWRQWAMAASALLATLAVLAVWLLRPSDTLAREVVAHVQAEPQSWLTAQHVTAAGIDAVLRRSGVGLDLTSDTVTYVQSCWFRGHYVPHLVLQTAHGPATVMILRHEQLRERRSFHEAGMDGVIVPAGAGSIAVLERGGGNSGNLDELAQQMQRDLHWLADGH
jgi:uncharacterized protein DUF3379